ncbi:MAG: hypothetical protein UFF97_00565, partial [Collinsella sp.]|nr:hypothetical protein [Collinsella sp.]
LEHAAQAGKIEGPDAGGVPEPGPCGVVAIYSVQVSGRSSQAPLWWFLLGRRFLKAVDAKTTTKVPVPFVVVHATIAGMPHN